MGRDPVDVAEQQRDYEEIFEKYGEEEVKEAIRWALDNPEYVCERLEIIKKRLAEEDD